MMAFSRYIQTIDTHTMGEPTRVVINGMPKIGGRTIFEKKQYLAENLDSMRKFLMNEPRGHQDMFGAILLPPCIDSCDLGVIFMDSGGYLNMCGHGTIAAISVAIHIGLIEKKEKIRLDAPAGVIECRVSYKNEKIHEVIFLNVPSFLIAEDVKVQVENIGEVTLDIAFGGSIFGIVDASRFGLELKIDEQLQLSNIGTAIKKAINEQYTFCHPVNKQINKVDLVEFSLKQGNNYYRNTVVFGRGQIDRSPCGTGTSAKMAILHKKGKLELGQKFVHESIINSTFTGRIVGETTVEEYSAVIPEISGKAWITSFNQFVLEDSDPYVEGFCLASGGK
ncbi:proline racemase family protein [Peribacillus butanolivorans]|uniref:proline racemase family protein n=1 Tax=Peribacillus butanolivorans TaxID=421767 RepID=UPI0036D77123